MIAGFIAIIVLFEASVSDFVLTPVFTRAKSSLHNTRREHGVHDHTPCATKERQRRPRTGQHPLNFQQQQHQKRQQFIQFENNL